MNKKYERVLFVFASTVFLIFGVRNAAISIRAETNPPDAETVKETLPETSGSTENQESIASTETDQIDSNQEEVQDSDQIIENDNNNGWSEDYQKYYIGGATVTGFQTIDGNDYYFNDEGIKTVGQKQIDNNWYCFLKNQTEPVSNGIMVKKQFFNLYDSYHASWDNDKTVYYDQNGHMLYKQQYLDGFWYCFDKYSGAMKTGFVNITGDYHAENESDKTVYYDQNGHMLYKQKYLGGFWYCFDKYSGAMKRGFVNLTGDYHDANEKDKIVYYDQNGHMLYKQQYLDGFWYCFDKYSGAMKRGFVNLTGDYHAANEKDKIVYYDQNGHMLYKQQYLDGFWYCFDKYSGTMKTGFVNITGDYHAENESDKTVYYDKNGHMLYKQKYIDGYWYCFNKYSGAMQKGFVLLSGDYHSDKESDKTVYYDENGHMLYKQKYIDGYWYCFDQYSGAMKTGFVLISGNYHSANESDKTVYYDKNGHMLYKQKYIDGYWYCFDKYTGAMKTGFVLLSGDYHSANESDKTVYYDENGRMVHADFDLDGIHYYVNSANGAITGTDTSTEEFTADENGVYMYGIDISEHNGYNIDFSQYTDQFIIIRVNWGTNTDSMAEYYMDQCEKYGIRYGVYCYSYALDEDGAASEAYYTLDLIKNRTISCGVWFDMEDADNYKANNNALNATTISTICQTYCKIIQNAGYYSGIYSSLSWFDYYIQNCNQYDHWVAAWGQNDGTLSTDTSEYGTMHQYTSTPLDKDVMYVDPSTYII